MYNYSYRETEMVMTFIILHNFKRTDKCWTPHIWVRLMVSNATFNNISVISWHSAYMIINCIYV